MKDTKGNENVETAFLVNKAAREVALHSSQSDVEDSEGVHSKMEAGGIQNKKKQLGLRTGDQRMLTINNFLAYTQLLISGKY